MNGIVRLFFDLLRNLLERGSNLVFLRVLSLLLDIQDPSEDEF